MDLNSFWKLLFEILIFFVFYLVKEIKFFYLIFQVLIMLDLMYPIYLLPL